MGEPFSASFAAAILHRNVNTTIIAPTIRTLSALGTTIVPPFGARYRGALVRHICPVRVLMYNTWNGSRLARSEEHTSELQSLMRISYAVFCLKKKKKINKCINTNTD